MKKCSCGNPVRKGQVKRLYKTKDGEVREYLYERAKCRECTNAYARRARKHHNTEMQKLKKEIHRRQMILDGMRAWYLDPDHTQSQFTMKYFYFEGYKIWRELQRLEKFKAQGCGRLV